MEAAVGTRVVPRAARVHWPEVLMEALGLGLFMVSAGGFGTLLEAPGSPVHAALPDPLVRRAIMGLLMGLTAIGLIYSPWGKRSGAHINPAVTLTFLRLGRVKPGDAAAYVVAQFLGGLAGVLLVAAVLGDAFLAPPVGAVATMPGVAGAAVAFVAELALAAVLMSVVLALGGSRLGPYTGLVVGAIVCHLRTRRQLPLPRPGQPLRRRRQLLPVERRGEPGAHHHGQRAAGRRPPGAPPRRVSTALSRGGTRHRRPAPPPGRPPSPACLLRSGAMAPPTPVAAELLRSLRRLRNAAG